MESSPASRSTSLNFKTATTRSVLVHNTNLQIVHGNLRDEHTDVVASLENEELLMGRETAAGGERRNAERTGEETCGKGAAGTKDSASFSSKYVINVKFSTDSPATQLESLVLDVLWSCDNSSELISSASLPAICAGGFPKNNCAEVMITSFVKYLMENLHTKLNIVRLVASDLATVKLFEEEVDSRRRRLKVLGEAMRKKKQELMSGELMGAGEKSAIAVESEGEETLPQIPSASRFVIDLEPPQSSQAHSAFSPNS